MSKKKCCNPSEGCCSPKKKVSEGYTVVSSDDFGSGSELTWDYCESEEDLANFFYDISDENTSLNEDEVDKLLDNYLVFEGKLTPLSRHVELTGFKVSYSKDNDND
jgi:hypothetical protein